MTDSYQKQKSDKSGTNEGEGIKHIGVWRDIEPTHFEILTVGYRYYKIADGK